MAMQRTIPFVAMRKSRGVKATVYKSVYMHISPLMVRFICIFGELSTTSKSIYSNASDTRRVTGGK